MINIIHKIAELYYQLSWNNILDCTISYIFFPLFLLFPTPTTTASQDPSIYL